jgi:hypothetical protein
VQGRSLADLANCHYALFANNQHPLQHSTYSEFNRFLQILNNKTEAERSEDFEKRFSEVVETKKSKLNQSEGETLSIDDMSLIWIQIKDEAHQANKMSLNTRTKTGDVTDYLETRRPFGTAPQ